LELAQHILECLPLGIVGLGDDDLIALANRKAHELLLPDGGALVGLKASEVFPEALNGFYRHTKSEENQLNYNGSIEMPDHGVSVNGYRLPIHNSNSGSVVVMMLKEGNGGKP
jgi:hypothetical protein